MSHPANANLTRIRRAAFWARWLTGLLVLAAFCGTHFPIPSRPADEVVYSDTFLHGVAYFVLTISLLLSWELSAGILRPKHFFMVWLLGTIYAAMDEVTQIPVGRTCDLRDWLADILGIVVGLLVFWVGRSLFYRLL